MSNHNICFHAVYEKYFPDPLLSGAMGFRKVKTDTKDKI